MEIEPYLREKLKISDKSSISFSTQDNEARNKTYVVNVDGKPEYFVKEEPYKGYQEKKAFEFLQEHPIIPTIFPVDNNEECMIFPYKKLENVETRKYFDFIHKMQNEFLEVPSSEYIKYFNDKKFKNKRVNKFPRIVDHNKEDIANFWSDTQELKDFWYETKDNPEHIPLIFNQGDFHSKNLQKDKDRNILLIDLEETCYNPPSWELSRALQSGGSKHYKDLKKFYLDNINLKDKETLDKLIDRDFIIRAIADSIGMQKMYGIQNNPPLERLKGFYPIIKNILKNTK